jgi:exopolysaccharide biosynthesis predicted pyruvyltransferase EpsI
VQTPALIVDPAFHANVGDSLIYVAELEFLRSLGFEQATTSVHVCGYHQASKWAKEACPLYLQKKDPKQVAESIAYWQGGGNWGDLWHVNHVPRINSFKPLLEANYSVVSMPQSFHYINNAQKARDTQTMKNSIAAGLNLTSTSTTTTTTSFWNESEAVKQQVASRVTFAWREVKSFEAASKEYPFATNLLVPDIAFYAGPFQQQPTPEKESIQLDLLVFLRSDKESVVASKRNNQSIQDILNGVPGGGGSDLKFLIADWDTRFAMWPSDDFLFTDSAIQLLSLGRVVVCDRLHAAILCYLSGIPFVYIDQATGKVNKTLSVAFDSWEGCNDGETAMWARAQSLEEALALAVGFLEKYDL